MKCPLVILVCNRPDWKDETYTGDCLQEECAWWDQVHGTCGELTKAQALWHIKEVLSHIAKELTLLRPPAK